MEFCPQEADWGNIADWATFAATLAIGIIAALLTRAANRIATEAHEARKEADQRETHQIALKVMREMLSAGAALRIARDLLEDRQTEGIFLSDIKFREHVTKGVCGLGRTNDGEDPQLLAKLPGNIGIYVTETWSHVDFMLETINAIRSEPTEEELTLAYHKLRGLSIGGAQTAEDAWRACSKLIQEAQPHRPSTIRKHSTRTSSVRPAT